MKYQCSSTRVLHRNGMDGLRNTWSKSLQSGWEHSNLLDHYTRRVLYRCSHRTAPYLLCGNSFQLGTTRSYVYGRPTQCMPQILQSVSANLGLQYPSSVVYRGPKHSTGNQPMVTVSYLAATVRCLSIHLDSLRGSSSYGSTIKRSTGE